MSAKQGPKVRLSAPANLTLAPREHVALARLAALAGDFPAREAGAAILDRARARGVAPPEVEPADCGHADTAPTPQAGRVQCMACGAYVRAAGKIDSPPQISS